jgi:hypothetical protein
MRDKKGKVTLELAIFNRSDSSRILNKSTVSATELSTQLITAATSQECLEIEIVDVPRFDLLCDLIEYN